MQLAVSVLLDGMLGKGPRANRLGAPHLPHALGRFAVLQLALSVLPDGMLGTGLLVALRRVALLQLALTALPDGLLGKGP